jgi:hypothetical protein
MNNFFGENSFDLGNDNASQDQFIPYEISLKNNERHFHEFNAPSERPTFSNTHLENENREIVDPEPFIQIDDNRTIIDKKKCGRKRKNENNTTEHNKFSDDNVRRRVKHLCFKYLLLFINSQIKEIYNNKIGQGIFQKQLQTLNQSQISNAKILFNQQLLEKNLGEIFSDKVTGKLTNIPSDHNKKLIQKLINEEDIEKRIYFQKLFNVKLKDCFEHFSGNKVIDELEGMELFNEISEITSEYLEKYEDGKEYIHQLEYYLKNYERIIKSKRARKERIKKNEKK